MDGVSHWKVVPLGTTYRRIRYTTPKLRPCEINSLDRRTSQVYATNNQGDKQPRGGMQRD